MAEIGSPQPQPNVGIRGNPQSLPVYQPHEKLNATGSVPGFVSAFSDLATTPSALGSLFSNLATSSTNKLMDKWGYELGSNPHGNLLPSITKADERFEMAYLNQAQATLGLHANKLMMDGQLELQKAYKLTPEMIQSYTQNMASGLDDILAQAPDTIKPTLHNSFSSALLRTTDQINQKMVTQQKAAYKDQMALYSASITKNIYESAMAGNEKEAKTLLDSQMAHNAQLKATGIISAVQEQANNQTAKQTYLTGVYSQRALAAKQNGTDAEFLASLQNKPEGVSYLDWQSVTKNVLGNISQAEALEKRDQTLNSAQFDLAIVEDRVTSETIEELRSKQTPENFAQSMTKYVSHLNKMKNKQGNTNDLARNWGSAIVHADVTPKVQNETFQYLTSAYQQRQTNLGKPAVSDIEAKTVIAQSAGASIPQFVKELNNMLTSGHPDLMIQASNSYRILGGLKAPISTQAKAMLFGFDSQIQQGRTPADAAQIVKENVASKNKDELLAQDSIWTQYKKEHLASFDDEVKHAKSLMDIPWFTKVPNIAAYTIQVNKAFESNLRLLNGDVEAAKAMTSHNLEQSYGLTYANGYKEYTYLPIENFMFGTGSGGNKNVTGLIHNDASLQVMKQIESTKEAFDKGLNDFYYRVIQGPDFEEAFEAKKELDNYLSKTSFGTLPEAEYVEANKKVDDLKRIVSEYNSTKTIQIERVWRGSGFYKPTLKPEGMINGPNIELDKRKVLNNAGGSHSTVSTITAQFGRNTFLLPTVIDGKRLTNDEAYAHFRKTHEHMGEFKTQRDADLFDEALHTEKGWLGKGNVWPKYPTEGHVEKFELHIEASPSIGLGVNSATPVSGAYDIRVRTPGGRLEPLIGVDNLFSGQMVYRPDFNKLKTQYFALNGLSNPDEENETDKIVFTARKNYQEEYDINQGINKYGRGFR